jgi:membrane protease subunit (stomatin/prohibitin family)
MSEFMEILEWFDETGQGMAHRLPQEGSGALKMGAQLVVRESQEAIFFKSGKALDRFGPGRVTLSTNNLPLLTSALSLPWGFRSPFRAEIVFINRIVFTGLRWGTHEPVVFKDEKLGHVRLRAFGNYTIRVEDSLAFVNRIVGTTGHFATDQLQGYLRDVIVARLNDYLGENLKSVFDLPAVYDETGQAMREKLRPDFAKYGLELVDFFVQAITPPEEVQRIVDAQGGLALIPDMPAFLQYRIAGAIGSAPGAASGSPDGASGGVTDQLVGAGIGLGAGLMMPGMLREALGCGTAVATAPTATAACVGCGTGLPPGARFCPGCGRPVSGQG